MNTLKKVMKNVKPALMRNVVPNSNCAPGILNAAKIFFTDFPQSNADQGARVWWVSGKNARMEMMLSRLKPAANQNGVAAENQARTFGSDSLPPKYGPRMNPRPNAAPMSPKFFARCSGLLTSAMDAIATAKLPPVNPSSRRDANSRGMLC